MAAAPGRQVGGLMAGVQAMQDEGAGLVTLRTRAVMPIAPPRIEVLSVPA